MKYRRLRIEELTELESSFTRFLASNTVTADDWVKLKATDVVKAEKLIELFSDIVFDSTLKKLEYLEFKTINDMKLFKCGKDKIEMVGLMIEGNTTIDFTKPQQPVEMINALKNTDAQVKLYSAEKTYAKEREQELFDMMESGCLISDGTLFNTVKELQPK